MRRSVGSLLKKYPSANAITRTIVILHHVSLYSTLAAKKARTDQQEVRTAATKKFRSLFKLWYILEPSTRDESGKAATVLPPT